MNGSGLKVALVLIGSAIALTACTADDDDAAAATAGAAGEAGAEHTGSGGVEDDGTGGIAGASGTFEANCKKMCAVVRACEAPEINGEGGSSSGGAAGEAGAPADSEIETPVFDQCLKDCDFIAAGLSMDPCRPEFETYFACQGEIDPEHVECADGNVRWDLYCKTETAVLMECQEF